MTPVQQLYQIFKAQPSEIREAEKIVATFKEDNITVTFNNEKKRFTVQKSTEIEETKLFEIFTKSQIDMQSRILVFEYVEGSNKEFALTKQDTATLKLLLCKENTKDVLKADRLSKTTSSGENISFILIVHRAEEKKENIKDKDL